MELFSESFIVTTNYLVFIIYVSIYLFIHHIFTIGYICVEKTQQKPSTTSNSKNDNNNHVLIRFSDN